MAQKKAVRPLSSKAMKSTKGGGAIIQEMRFNPQPEPKFNPQPEPPGAEAGNLLE